MFLHSASGQKAKELASIGERSITAAAKTTWTHFHILSETMTVINADILSTLSRCDKKNSSFIFVVTQAELSAGAHKFNFSCVLPPQLPTSFESKYGYIRYQIKVEMERPWKYDIKHCFAFTVIKVLDLNYESPALRSPLKREATKNFFFGLSSKTLFISAEIPMSGYVAGQNVAISITVNNETTTDVEETKFQLMKIIHYNSQTPRRKIRQRVEMAAEVKNVGVPAKSKGFVQAHLIIPPVPPTNLAYCRVLQVSYEIQFVACVGGIHRNPVLRLPLTIGTVPLQNNYYQPAPTTTMPLTAWNIQHAGSSNAQPSAQLPLYPALPVPQYPMETRAAPMPPGTHDLREIDYYNFLDHH